MTAEYKAVQATGKHSTVLVTLNNQNCLQEDEHLSTVGYLEVFSRPTLSEKTIIQN